MMTYVIGLRLSASWLAARYRWRFPLYAAMIVGVLLFSLATPSVALAQSGGFCGAATAIGAGIDPDPVSGIILQANCFTGNTTGYAKTLFSSLVLIEVVVLGIQMALFRDNLGDFFGGIALKVIGIGFFLWLIEDGPTLLNTVIHSFQNVATGSGAPDPLLSIAAMVTALVLTLTALATSQAAIRTVEDTYSATIGGIFVLGSGIAGEANIFSFNNDSTIGLFGFAAFTAVMAIGTAALSYVLIYIETIIVTGVGIIMLGFSGSKYTQQFSQGYLSYAVNVGVKYLAMYIAFALATPQIVGGLGYAAAGAGTAAAATAALAAPLSFVGAIMVLCGLAKIVVGSALIWFFPNLASAMLNGQSSMSGSAMLGNIMSSASGFSSMRAGMAQQQAHQGTGQQQQRSLDAANGVGGGRGGVGGGASGGTDQSTGVASAGSLQSGDLASAGGAGSGAGAANGGSATAGTFNSSGGGSSNSNIFSVAPGGGTPSVGAGATSGSGANGAIAGNGAGSAGSAGGVGGGASPGALTSSGAPPATAIGAASPRAAVSTGGGAASGGGAVGGGGAGAGAARPGAGAGSGAPSSRAAAAAAAVAGGGAGGGSASLGGAGGETSSGSTGSESGFTPLSASQPYAPADASPPDSLALRTASDWEKVADADPERFSMQKQALQNERQENIASEKQAMAYALSGLAQAVPRGEVQPSAVQIRLGMPEKL